MYLKNILYFFNMQTIKILFLFFFCFFKKKLQKFLNLFKLYLKIFLYTRE